VSSSEWFGEREREGDVDERSELERGRETVRRGGGRELEDSTDWWRYRWTCLYRLFGSTDADPRNSGTSKYE
jgi:hypothetical protein